MFNEAVRSNAEFNYLYQLLEALFDNLPLNSEELDHVFKILTANGTTISISLVLNRLKGNIEHPIVVKSECLPFSIWFCRSLRTSQVALTKKCLT